MNSKYLASLRMISSLFITLLILIAPITSIIALEAPLQSLDVNGVNVFNVTDGYNESHGIAGITFDEGTKILTMTHANVNSVHANGDLDIVLVGNNTIDALTDSAALLAMGGDLTITGDAATLSITAFASDQPAISIGAGGRLTIGATGTVITVTVTEGILNNCEDTYVVDGNTFNSPDSGDPMGPPPGDPLQISIDGTLVIDETADPQVTSASGTGWSIEQGFMGIYQLTVDGGTTLPYITGIGDGALSISSIDGSFSIAENEDSRSINMNGNVMIFLSNESGNVSLVGGIYTEGEVSVRDSNMISIGSSGVPSITGISARALYVGSSNLSIYTSGTGLQYYNGTPLEGEGMIVESGAGHSLIVESDIATANVLDVIVSGGGTIDLSYVSGLGSFTPKASHWPWIDMTGTEEENPLPTTVTCEEGTDATNKYVMTSTEGNFLLESTAGTLYQLGWNIPGAEDSIVTNGTVRVIAANGFSFTSADYTDYSIEAGSTVTIELLPDYGYQYVSGGLNGNQTIPDDGKASYTFTMPDNHLHLSAIFERTSDIISLDTEKIAAANIAVPSTEINGNAELLIGDATDIDEASFESQAGDFEIDTYLDLSLNEVIYKGTTEDVWRTNITELNESTTVTLTLSDDLKGHAEYIVLREHEGVIEEIEGVYNANTGTLTFDTDAYSTYALAYNDPINPPTYDNIVWSFVIGIISISGLFIVSRYKREFYKSSK